VNTGVGESKAMFAHDDGLQLLDGIGYTLSQKVIIGVDDGVVQRLVGVKESGHCE
jgi:hypothetical protein